MTEINKSNVRIGCLIRVVTADYSEYHYQNFDTDSVTIDGRTYDFVPIDFIPPQKTLDLDNATARILLPNLPEIRQTIEEKDGFRNSITETRCVFPDAFTWNPYLLDLMFVRSTKITGTVIEIDLQSPFSAVGALFPSIYWTTGNSPGGLDIVGFAPEVPYVSQVNLS